jgi:hypothetical protein
MGALRLQWSRAFSFVCEEALLHTRDREFVTFVTLQALSLVENAGTVQIQFTLRLRGPTKYGNARWMRSLHVFLHDIEWIMFHGHLEYFKKPPLGGRPNAKLGDHGTPNAHNRCFILFYQV